jgi:hypothetical protein
MNFILCCSHTFIKSFGTVLVFFKKIYIIFIFIQSFAVSATDRQTEWFV